MVKKSVSVDLGGSSRAEGLREEGQGPGAGTGEIKHGVGVQAKPEPKVKLERRKD